MDTDEAYAELDKVALVRAKLPEWQKAAVLKARLAKIPWSVIATRLGVSIRAAQQWAELDTKGN